MSDILSYTSALLKVPVRAVDSAARRLASHPGQPYTATASKKRKSLASPPKENDEPKGVGNDINDAASPRQPLPPPTMHQIRVLLQLWKHGMVSGDAKAVADRYSPNAVMIPFDSHIPLTGRQAIQDYYERILPVYKPRSIKVLHGTVAIPGANETTENECCLAQDNGIYDITSPCGNLVRMRYTFVYVRDPKNGRWRIVHHGSYNIGIIEDSSLSSTDEYSKTCDVQGRRCGNSNDEGTANKETTEPSSEEKAESCIPPMATLQPTTTTTLPQRRPSQIDHLVGLLTGTKTITQNDLILLSMSDKPGPVAETKRSQ